MSFRLIDRGWDKELEAALQQEIDCIRVIVPFIKQRAAERLLRSGCLETIEVITRFHLGDFSDGVSDIGALRLLLSKGAKIRGVKNLHSKLYLFGESQVIVTSANLTEAALTRNHEFGFIAGEAAIVAGCRKYFDDLWKRAGVDLTPQRLAGWESKVTEHLAKGGRKPANGDLGDEGVDTGLGEPSFLLPDIVEGSQQGFVKFMGEGDNRASVDLRVLEVVKNSGCHWACCYPKGKRPRKVKDGAIMFMGRLVENPNDTIIFGRAIGLRHVDSRDVATTEDIQMRTWKANWPNYIRVHHGEFLGETLANGIRLSELMDTLKADSFVSTQFNARQGSGNTDPRKAFKRQAAVELTQEAVFWLNQKLEEAFAKHGRLSRAELDTLDWPTLPSMPLESFQTWLEASQGLKSNTAREYLYFLKRCIAHYGVKINPQTVPNEKAADDMLNQVTRVVEERGRWAEGTFDERDVRQNLRPALRAFGRYNSVHH